MLIHMLSALWTLTSLSAVCLKEGDAHCFYLRRLGPSRTARSVWNVTSDRSPQFQGTPPLRRDDTADTVTLVAMVVKLQTGIDEVGRQRQQRLRQEFAPSTVEQFVQL